MLSVKSQLFSRLLHNRRSIVLVALALFAVTLAIPMLKPQIAAAEAPFDNWQTNASAQWINRMTIKYNGVFFVDPDPSDNVYIFNFAAVTNPQCVSSIVFNAINAFGIGIPSPYSDPSYSIDAGLRLFVPKANSTDCEEATAYEAGGANKLTKCNGHVSAFSFNGKQGFKEWSGCEIKVNDSGARLYSFFVDTDGNVKSINPSQAITFVAAPNAWNGETVYIRSDQLQAQCKNIITKVNGQWILYSLKSDDKGSTNWPQYYDIVKTATGSGAIQQDRCSNNPDAFIKVYLAGLASSAKPTGGGYYDIYVGTTANQGGSKAANSGSTIPGSGAQTGGNAAGDTKPTCESSGFSLNWILCPIYNATTSFVDWMLSIIQAMLRSDDFLDTSKPIYAIWSQFRIYANIFLVLALIIIVFGQSIGTSVAEAYMARTFLFNLFFVVAFVNVSIYILAGFYDGVNIIGTGVGAALTAPLDGAGMFKFTPTAFQQGGVAVVTGGAGIAAAASGVLWGGLIGPQAALFLGLFVFLPVLFGVISIFLTLMALRALRLVLVGGSPVFGAFHALENTKPYAKQYREWVETTGVVSIILPVIFALCNIMSYITITEAQSPERNILTAKFASVADMFMGYAFTIAPLLAGGLAFSLAGGIVKRGHDFLSGAGKRAHQGILGNENDPNSLRNKTRRRFGAALTQGQKSILERGDKAPAGIKGAWRRGRARFVGSGIFGDVTQRQSTYNAIAAKERAAKTDTGDDAEIFAGGGYIVRKGQADHLGNIDPNEDRYFNSKGQKISQVLYDRGKRLHGANSHEVGEALMYTLGKAQTEEDKAAWRHAFAKNALEQGWSEGEMKGAYAHAAYPHKRNHASVWYSGPEYERNAQGAITGVRFKDVATNDGSYDDMVKDLHKSRGSFDLSGDRHEDFQVMYQRQQQLEARVASGTSTDEERLRLGRTYEIFDAVSSRMQTGLDPDGNVTTNGATPAAQAVILAAVNQRRLAMTESDSNGTRTFFDPSTMPAPPPGTKPVWSPGQRAVAVPLGATDRGQTNTAGGRAAVGVPGTAGYQPPRAPRSNLPNVVTQ